MNLELYYNDILKIIYDKYGHILVKNTIQPQISKVTFYNDLHCNKCKKRFVLDLFEKENSYIKLFTYKDIKYRFFIKGMSQILTCDEVIIKGIIE